MAQARISRFGQIGIYVGKCFRIFFHEKGWKILISSTIIAAIIAWVIGDNTFVVFESTKSGVFALVCACIWIGLFNSIQSICKERAIIKREHRTGLHISAYVIAHMIYELTLCAMEALIMTVVLALFRDLPSHGILFSWIGVEFYLSFLLVIYCADCLGLCVSAIVKTENAAMTVMPFVLIIQLVMSGMMFTLPDNAQPVKYLTISKWGMDAICSSADINENPTWDTLQKFQEAVASDEEIHSWKDLHLTQEYELDFDGTAEHVAFTWLMLVCYCALYGAIAIVALEFIDRDKR